MMLSANYFPNLPLEFNIANIFLYIFCFLLIVVNIYLALSYNLLKSILLMSLSSLIICVCYLLMDAPDVAMTEASLGACLSTAILLKIAKKLQLSFNSAEKLPVYKNILCSLVCILFAVCFMLVCYDLPDFGQLSTPMHQHISKYYINNTTEQIGIPSFVAAILASYRGYDTLGETTVILCAGISVILIFANKKTNQ
ncbi:DUF4040 domain-containing protein [Orientia tsutsugamushi]|uniref:Multisubunit Na+/H+ antiporter, MnhB subunit n=2 Tax=Orientia tsutsugamushi TaxID=784 RepID=B3CSN3_ORITI|nr:hypothetical protein OTSKATO_0096 [Orientia tsutsugamushi str. Kato PP]BAG40280.1 multisubunit Na+/H+ antiporter, MnhB subunit [Orientia tsutsugamushi str. Ikeda]